MRRDSEYFSYLKRGFAACFLIFTGITGWLYLQEYREEQKIDGLQAVHEETAESVDDAFSESENPLWEQMSAINPEYLGWLTVSSTGISLPVVEGRDNDYYLTHDFYGEQDRYGTLFADCLTEDTDDGNLLIYGHHMKNGSMFGTLTDYCRQDFFNENSLIRWEGREGDRFYTVFAVLVVPGYEEDEAYFPVRDYLGQLSTEEQETLLKELKDRALLWRNLSFQEDERFLFLMTCDYTRENGRLLLCARRGEF